MRRNGFQQQLYPLADADVDRSYSMRHDHTVGPRGQSFVFYLLWSQLDPQQKNCFRIRVLFVILIMAISQAVDHGSPEAYSHNIIASHICLRSLSSWAFPSNPVTIYVAHHQIPPIQPIVFSGTPSCTVSHPKGRRDMFR